MADDMSLSQVPLTLIVAATTKNGIGKSGGLPWPMLKKEMAYFARVTKRVPAPKSTESVRSDATNSAMLNDPRKNAVIMGRKTWESIPPKFRPLKDRTNVVISSQDRSKLGDVPDDVVVASDMPSALKRLEEAVRSGKTASLGRAYVIGGSSIYKAALEMDQTNSILLTRIQRDYECDTFFPIELQAQSDQTGTWKRKTQEELQDFVGEGVQAGGMSESHGGGEVQYEFQLYERP